jgi:DNA adenine methylase
MRKSRSYAEIINDLDGEIVNVFRVLREPDLAARLESQLRLTPFARDEFVEAYEPCDDPLERARRTIVKSYMGFGSAAVTQQSPTLPGAGFKPTTGFRNNSNRSGTAPAQSWANLPSHVASWSERLTGVVIENRPAECLISGPLDQPKTLWYVDPPYVHSTRALTKHRTPQSYRFEMSDEDHIRLARGLKILSGYVVVSGYASDIYDHEYRDWTCVKRDTHADGARDRVECLWLNPACIAATGRALDFGDTP